MSELEIVQRFAKDLIPYEQNAKLHSKEQIDKLAKVMLELGYDVPIVIDEENNILKGHCRREAAIVAGMGQVGCIVRRGLTEAQKAQLRLSDNRLAESAWDDEMLRLELQMLMDESADLTLTGFDEDEIKDLFEEESPPDSFGDLNSDRMASEFDATCPRCQFQFTVSKNNG